MDGPPPQSEWGWGVTDSLKWVGAVATQTALKAANYVELPAATLTG